MKKLLIILIACCSFLAAQGQEMKPETGKTEFFLKGGVGTSWIILPKVFLVDPNDITNNAQILPATNGFSGYFGFQSVFVLGDGWLFTPEVNLAYTSGEIRVNLVAAGDTTSVQNLQSYVRAEIPLNIGMRSRDGFWVSFGPTVYFTLSDNKGFENAVVSAFDDLNIPQNSEVKSGVPVGVRFRLAAYAPVGEKMFIDIKFESDLNQYFRYENSTYEMKFSLQNISIGAGYYLNRK